ncbi:MAG: hypothetical protein C5B53_03670 [Candidatus Melainabacteria bacterium]|nr:MAG: hypothetical protein C5B53_03670 [Candidatus Melainabacteria bacterium]
MKQIWQKFRLNWQLLLLAVLFLLLFGQATVRSEEEYPTVRGTVTDENLKPLAGVGVKLISKDASVNLSTTTKGTGQFILPHKPCKSLCLEVSPRKGSSLATARIENIPGEESRRIVVELQRGCEIHGRVVHENKGLKGLSVSVTAASENHKHEKLVHGGGRTKTGRDGTFQLILTPGMKTLSIANERYEDLTPSYARKLTVETDGIIPDIELPLKHKPKIGSQE